MLQRCLSTTGVTTISAGNSKPVDGGTRLTLWTNIGRRFIAMGAAGWHICFDVLDHLLSGTPMGRIVGPEAMKFGGGSDCTRSTPSSSVLKCPTGRLRGLKSKWVWIENHERIEG